MEPKTSGRSPREEGELEDGEISDDENDDKPPIFLDQRPNRGARSGSGSGRPGQAFKPSSWPPHEYRMKMPFNRGQPLLPLPHPQGGYRPDCGPVGPERHSSGPPCEPSPRSSFWERSHSALGRFNHRGRPFRGRFIRGRDDWGDRGLGKPPLGRPPFQGGGSKKESPSRKPKIRTLVRYTTVKAENGIQETFEDLLRKYKQIQDKLECINKEERIAQASKEELPPALKELPAATQQVLPLDNSVQEKEREAGTAGSPQEELIPEKRQVKAFQAFNLKPLRQKLLTPAERDERNKATILEEPSEESPAASSEPSCTAKGEEENRNVSGASSKESSSKDLDDIPEKVTKEDDDELSELQLRLLALQSASKKWQQKEQQVLKESKEKLTKSRPVQQKSKTVSKSTQSKKSNSTGCVSKQARRKQQVRTWKLQQQKEQERCQCEAEEKRRTEEEERRKREDEIRKIRDLSNQDEQYNRFMKLVGVKRRSRSKSLDVEYRKPLNKQGTDISGSLYQYDNYDEVAMETDSENNSPASSPAHMHPVDLPYFLQLSHYPSGFHQNNMVMQSIGQGYLDSLTISSEIPPPLPPLPPDEPEQPPKPPFADEEEEEEMLLREELLKSLANKRAVKPEETSGNSVPPSPPMTVAAQMMQRSNLSAVSINTVPQSRLSHNKFPRGPAAPRQLLMLPRHKTVVVQLNDSDDSESDGENANTKQSVFGGLESMIKEARRTVEASKPKAPSKSEKENNPVKTPEILPDDKKNEYRLLKEELASREKQRVLKSEQSKGISSPASSDAEAEMVGRRVAFASKYVAEVQSKLEKHRSLLLKDELVLKNLIQQELKKKESLKVSESKSAKLKEQLLANEKIVNANRIFLKKLQEQIQKVQHRVSVKKNHAVKLAKDLAQAKVAAGQKQGKRKNEINSISPNKVLRLDNSLTGSPRKQYSQLIAQEKRRLQQLELEYALKIQQLKEAQMLRNKEVLENVTTVVEESLQEYPSFHELPQPSLHDLTQDKLTLDSEENEVEDEVLSPSVRERRRSFRESSSFTKPNLKHPETPASKESLNKPVKKAVEEPELFLGLNIEDLQKLYKEADCVKELFEKTTAMMLVPAKGSASGQEIQVDLDAASQPAPRSELKPSPFGQYHSPLLAFKSYRFSPYFRTKEKLYLSSVSYSNIIEPKKCFCRFDLTGTCNADDCQWQHMRDCTLSRNTLFQDILSYNLSLIGCSESTSREEISIATEKYIDKLFGVNKDRMPTDQMAVLLVSKVNESKSHVPPFTTFKEIRNWRPRQQKSHVDDGSSSDDESPELVNYDRCLERHWKNSSLLDAFVTPDDVRYFTSETDDIANLEVSVSESSRDVQLWIKLAYKYLNQKESTPSECLDSALNTLARALEDNRENCEVWCHYLSLFAKRGTKEEVQEMCETAVEYAPDYKVWWKFLNLESSFDGKDYVCGRVLQYLLGTVGGDNKSEVLSFQLLECLLYRVQLSLFTGRQLHALAILQNALKSTDGERSIAEHLLISDRCLAWLSYIHLIEFGCLPYKLYDPANSNPSRIVNKDPFLIPWQSARDIKTDQDMLFALFEDAVHACTEEHIPAGEKTAACLPIYRNMILLNQLLDRCEAAIQLCEKLLIDCPVSQSLLETLENLYVKNGEGDKAAEMWHTAFRNSPHSGAIFYSACKFLVSQGKSSAVSELLQEFVMAFCESSTENSVNILRYFLNVPVQYNFKAPCIKEPYSSELQAQVPYMWLIYCLWQSVHATFAEAADTFERALGVVMQQEIVQKLWLDYLIFTSSKLIGSKNKTRDFKMFTDLLHRCLVTVPTRYTVPFSSAVYWTNFEFHSKVVSFYLSCLPQMQHSKALERFRYIMPTNVELALRFLHEEYTEGNIQHLRVQARMLTSSIPTCLTTWKIAIAVENELKGRAEVRRLYRQALQKLPLCASLWKDQLLFEASEGGKTDNLRKLVSKCQEAGVSLDELLSLSSNRTEGKDH
ncbi:zinc finger C3H1 domain-containing protein-like [Polypterus senegalus]|uniref:zinc finger C3H1 domain-containing protein-like n=1 Tax=Polypterus senegalus TaxID=55291 RepID=UPI00196508E1|nr:zinc finger C3H1 domain-containing protein-like [Polypterus senegalus]